ncbi:MAG TPA: phosphopantetheine adenylyltransferase [Nitrososphaerales archaeon]|nr:phosphopantetheine adenylyltransferase [Nitrososphaerales archaeon]
MSDKKYSRVATGGTFDQFHAGHRRLLERSFELGDEVVIGLTSDEFARKHGKAPKQTFGQRRAGLTAYITRTFPGRRYVIAKLDDYFGPGIASKEVEALVASPETGKRVELANKLRAERGFLPLELVVVDWVAAEDGKPISSTRIRNGEIDEEGRLVRKGPGRRAGR